jgi:hypothetical protein
LAPIALDFAKRLAEAIDPCDREAFERAVDRLIARSHELSAEIARSRRTT